MKLKLPQTISSRFLLLALAVMLGMIAVVWVLIDRQRTMQAEITGLGRQTMHDMVYEKVGARGKAEINRLSRRLVNPMYYFDLDTIGNLAREALQQPDVSYVLIFDADGDIIHDGSGDIPTYGQQMQDPLAFEAANAKSPHLQWSKEVVDAAAPILIGDQKLGGVRIGYSLDDMASEEEVAFTAMRKRLDEIGHRHLVWVAPLLGLLLLLPLAAWIVLQRSMVRPIRQLADSARQIEAGNFAVHVPRTEAQDEVGDLTRAFARMSESVRKHDHDIRRMAYTDALTGMSNRLSFREALDASLLEVRGTGRHLALLFADIDDFKRVNDTLGHDAGDDVLVQFASRISTAMQWHDVSENSVIARFGGDEFVIVLHQDAEGRDDIRITASRLAESLVSELSRPILIHDRQVFLGTSIGITLFPEDAVDATTLLKNGDIAMYQAKVAGKNCYRFYSRAMDQAVERRVRMEHDLRGAWERGELSVHYQPIYHIGTNKLAGAEALMRWQHPELGSIAPSVFIDVAEESGLIESIGREALRAACNDVMQWSRDFPLAQNMFMSVNVSPRQLRNGELPGEIVGILRDSGLQAQRLHVELTETAVLGDEIHASNLLTQLRRNGVKVWLDDFGTGFSGLSHLRRMPVDGVKIDRSFVADMLRDPDDLALTTAIIAMAHSLGIIVVAEGVEKQGQFDMLRDRGCDFAQGYWLGHPVSAHEFAGLLA